MIPRTKMMDKRVKLRLLKTSDTVVDVAPLELLMVVAVGKIDVGDSDAMMADNVVVVKLVLFKRLVGMVVGIIDGTVVSRVVVEVEGIIILGFADTETENRWMDIIPS